MTTSDSVIRAASSAAFGISSVCELKSWCWTNAFHGQGIDFSYRVAVQPFSSVSPYVSAHPQNGGVKISIGTNLHLSVPQFPLFSLCLLRFLTHEYKKIHPCPVTAGKWQWQQTDLAPLLQIIFLKTVWRGRGLTKGQFFTFLFFPTTKHIIRHVHKNHNREVSTLK